MPASLAIAREGRWHARWRRSRSSGRRARREGALRAGPPSPARRTRRRRADPGGHARPLGGRTRHRGRRSRAGPHRPAGRSPCRSLRDGPRHRRGVREAGARCVHVSSRRADVPARTSPIPEAQPRIRDLRPVRARCEAGDGLRDAGAAVVALSDSDRPGLRASTSSGGSWSLRPGRSRTGSVRSKCGGIARSRAGRDDACRGLAAHETACGGHWIVPAPLRSPPARCSTSLPANWAPAREAGVPLLPRMSDCDAELRALGPNDRRIRPPGPVRADSSATCPPRPASCEEAIPLTVAWLSARIARAR